jgi:hypothetical protein
VQAELATASLEEVQAQQSAVLSTETASLQAKLEEVTLAAQQSTQAQEASQVRHVIVISGFGCNTQGSATM